MESLQRHWIQPPGLPANFRVIVHIEVLPTGKILTSRIKESSGIKTLDRSVLDAVKRSDPLPPPPDPAAYDRNWNLTFVPQS